MPIIVQDGFQVNSTAPIDYRMVATSSVEREAINTLNKYDGMRVFQISDRQTYIWNAISATWSVDATGTVNPAGSGGLAGYVPYWTASTVIGTSSLYYNFGSGYYGLNTNAPQGVLQLNAMNMLSGTNRPIVFGFNEPLRSYIGSNYYYSGSQQFFTQSHGSVKLGFEKNGEFRIYNRKNSDASPTVKLVLETKVSSLGNPQVEIGTVESASTESFLTVGGDGSFGNANPIASFLRSVNSDLVEGTYLSIARYDVSAEETISLNVGLTSSGSIKDAVINTSTGTSLKFKVGSSDLSNPLFGGVLALSIDTIGDVKIGNTTTYLRNSGEIHLGTTTLLKPTLDSSIGGSLNIKNSMIYLGSSVANFARLSIANRTVSGNGYSFTINGSNAYTLGVGGSISIIAGDGTGMDANKAGGDITISGGQGSGGETYGRGGHVIIKGGSSGDTGGNVYVYGYKTGTNNGSVILSHDGTNQTGNVGVGTASPTTTLHVHGSLRFVTGNQGAGKLLQSDANGNATWATVSSLSGTGTTNYVAKYSSSNTLTNSLIFDNGSKIGLYTSTPKQEIHLGTNVSLTGSSFIGYNIYYDGTNTRYVNAGTGTLVKQESSGLSFYTYANGSADAITSSVRRTTQISNNGIGIFSGTNTPLVTPLTALQIGSEGGSPTTRPAVIVSKPDTGYGFDFFPYILFTGTNFTGVHPSSAGIGLSSDDYMSIGTEGNTSGIVLRVNSNYHNGIVNTTTGVIDALKINNSGDLTIDKGVYFTEASSHTIKVNDRTSSGHGSSLTIEAGDGNGTNKNGGNIILLPGAQTSTYPLSSPGYVELKNGVQMMEGPKGVDVDNFMGSFVTLYWVSSTPVVTSTYTSIQVSGVINSVTTASGVVFKVDFSAKPYDRIITWYGSGSGFFYGSTTGTGFDHNIYYGSYSSPTATQMRHLLYTVYNGGSFFMPAGVVCSFTVENVSSNTQSVNVTGNYIFREIKLGKS